jgi:hypothetical protein
MATLLHAPIYQPAVSVDATSTRLRSLMRSVLATEPYESSPDLSELQRAVRATAAASRERGDKPEQMVIFLKRATARGALRAATTREDDLHYRMILWSVREYFQYEE